MGHLEISLFYNYLILHKNIFWHDLCYLKIQKNEGERIDEVDGNNPVTIGSR